MKNRNATARWTGTLKQGKGDMKFSNYTGPYTFVSRFEEGEGTNPEELVGAAQAGCYSMFLAALLSEKGLNPDFVETTATVSLDADETGPCITLIKLDSKVKCDGISQEEFNTLAMNAKENCPISRLYAGGTAAIELTAALQ